MTKRLAIVILAVCVLAPSTTKGQGTVYAFDLRGLTGSSGRPVGNFNTFPANDPSKISLIRNNFKADAIELDPSGTILYVIDLLTDNLGTVDMDKGIFEPQVMLPGNFAFYSNGLAIDPTTNVFYLTQRINDNLYTLDPGTGIPTIVGEINGLTPDSLPFGNVHDITIDPSGVLYAFDDDQNSLWTVDKSTGNATWVAQEDFANFFTPQTLDFDAVTGTLYQAIDNFTNGRYGKWDLSTGTFVEIAGNNDFPYLQLPAFAVHDGTAFGYGGRDYVRFSAEDPTDIDSVRIEHETYAMDFDDSTGDLYFYDNNSFEIGIIDRTTGFADMIGFILGDFSPIFDDASGMSYDASSGTFYFSSEEDLFVLNVATRFTTRVGPFVDTNGNSIGTVVDIAINSAGEMFAYEVSTDQLWSVDKSTGECTVVGASLLPSNSAQGMDFDPSDDTLYAAINTGSGTGSYGTWDLTTGTFTEILDIASFPDPDGNSYQLEIAIMGVTVSFVAPESFSIFRGIQIDGILSDSFDSDDSYLKFNPGITLSPTEPPVWIEFESTLPTDCPASLSVTLEASANTVGLTQSIEMFNWNTGQYEEVDSRTASLNSDSVVSVDLTDSIAEYVQSVTGAIQTRTGWRATGIVFVYPWTICIDQVVWTVTD